MRGGDGRDGKGLGVDGGTVRVRGREGRRWEWFKERFVRSGKGGQCGTGVKLDRGT